MKFSIALIFTLSILTNPVAAPPSDRSPFEAPETVSVRYGQVELDIVDQEDALEINVRKDGELLESWKLDPGHFNLSPRDGDPLIFTLCDANKDGLDDLLVNDVDTVGAGPQAGIEYSNYHLFLQDDGKLEKHDIDLRQFAETRDHERVMEYLDRFFGQEDPLPLIGSKPSRDAGEYLLKDEERLVFNFRLKGSGKSLTIAIHENHDYLVYRFGKPDEVELEYLAPRDDLEKRFLYRNEENYGFSRFILTSLSFSIGEFRYSVYDNYMEGHMDDPKGIGVTVTNTATGKVSTLAGDQETRTGELKDLELLDWLEKKEIAATEDRGIPGPVIHFGDVSSPASARSGR